MFYSCISLDEGNYQELEAICATNNKENLIETDLEDDLKAEFKQLKREKQ